MRGLDAELVSAFIDGELSLRLKARVEELVRTSQAWRKELERQGRVRRLLLTDRTPEVEAARDRVWARLLGSVENRNTERVPLWRRMVAIPVPVLAAGVCLTLVLSFALVHNTARSRLGWMQITTAPSGVKQVQVRAPIQELESLLRSLEADAPSREVIIELPAETNVFTVGEPVLLRDHDVARGIFQ